MDREKLEAIIERIRRNRGAADVSELALQIADELRARMDAAGDVVKPKPGDGVPEPVAEAAPVAEVAVALSPAAVVLPPDAVVPDGVPSLDGTPDDPTPTPSRKKGAKS